MYKQLYNYRELLLVVISSVFLFGASTGSLIIDCSAIGIVLTIFSMVFVVLVGCVISFKTFKSRNHSNYFVNVKFVYVVILGLIITTVVMIYTSEGLVVDEGFSKFRKSLIITSIPIVKLIYTCFLVASMVLASLCVFDEKIQIHEKFIIALLVFFILVIDGSRANMILLSMMMFQFSVTNYSGYNKKELALLFVFFGAAFLFVMLLRGIDSLIPVDSITVGPLLLLENEAVITGQGVIAHKHLYPGYSLFSGFYTGARTIYKAVGFDLFPLSFENVSYTRHSFTFLSQYSDYYNSYYTIAIAKYFEGYWESLLLCFSLGFLSFYFSCKELRGIYLSIVSYFIFMANNYSVFHSQSICFLFFALFIFDFMSRYMRRI